MDCSDVPKTKRRKKLTCRATASASAAAYCHGQNTEYHPVPDTASFSAAASNLHFGRDASVETRVVNASKDPTPAPREKVACRLQNKHT